MLLTQERETWPALFEAAIARRRHARHARRLARGPFYGFDTIYDGTRRLPRPRFRLVAILTNLARRAADPRRAPIRTRCSSSCRRSTRTFRLLVPPTAD
jgi:hypothetical protein